MNMIFKNKWTWIVVAALVVWGFWFFSNTQSNAAIDKGTAGETAIAFIGDLAESATSSGEVVAVREAQLSLLTSGVVDNVNIEVGSNVMAGDVLIELDTVKLQRAVDLAESELIVAEAELADLLTEASSAELLSAEAAVISAQSALDNVLTGPTVETIAASQASVDAAQANVWAASGSLSAIYEVSDSDILQAQINLDTARENLQAAEEAWIVAAVCSTDANGNTHCETYDTDAGNKADYDVNIARIELALAESQLVDAQNPDSNSVASSQATVAARQASYDAAVARHAALNTPATADKIASAEASLISAQANLDILLVGALSTDIQTYETRVAQAQTNLRDAQNALVKASLIAPFNGTVTALYVAPGEMASGVAVELVDTSQLEVVLNVDEVDLGQLSVGQAAVISLETWPDAQIEGAVTAIAPSAITANGLVSFDVHLSLGPSELPILVGMTANADLITANTTDVLMVPNLVITADRDSDLYYVNVVLADGSTQEVQVTIGLRDSEFTQITSGLIEGDEVVIGELAAPVEEGGFGPNQ